MEDEDRSSMVFPRLGDGEAFASSHGRRGEQEPWEIKQKSLSRMTMAHDGANWTNSTIRESA
jgi:hypothetical protein